MVQLVQQDLQEKLAQLGQQDLVLLVLQVQLDLKVVLRVLQVQLERKALLDLKVVLRVLQVRRVQLVQLVQ